MVKAGRVLEVGKWTNSKGAPESRQCYGLFYGPCPDVSKKIVNHKVMYVMNTETI